MRRVRILSMLDALGSVRRVIDVIDLEQFPHFGYVHVLYVRAVFVNGYRFALVGLHSCTIVAYLDGVASRVVFHAVGDACAASISNANAVRFLFAVFVAAVKPHLPTGFANCFDKVIAAGEVVGRECLQLVCVVCAVGSGRLSRCLCMAYVEVLWIVNKLLSFCVPAP